MKQLANMRVSPLFILLVTLRGVQSQTLIVGWMVEQWLEGISDDVAGRMSEFLGNKPAKNNNQGGKDGGNKNQDNSGNLDSVIPDDLVPLFCGTSNNNPDSSCYSEKLQSQGKWTCQKQPMGEISTCVPSLLGVTLGRQDDECGCCGGDCPVRCECGCTTRSGEPGKMAHFYILAGLFEFERCLEVGSAETATGYSAINVTCSTSCLQDDAGTTEDGSV